MSIKHLNSKSEKQLFKRRVQVATGGAGLLLLLLVARAFYLQFIQFERYNTLSQKNQLTTLPIPPNRGLIYDRNGILLAENIPGFSVEIIPKLTESLDETLNKLQSLIKLSPEEIQSFHQRRKQYRAFQPIPVRLQLTQEEMTTLAVYQYQLPGVILSASLIRHYPYGKAFAHVIGYLGRINEIELGQIDRKRYFGTHMIGKTGIEKTYESRLLGQRGYQYVEMDSKGRLVNRLNNIQPTPGDDLYLTLDAPTQLAAFEALGDKKGAVVALEPNTGAVLALVSTPSFDPNLFSNNLNPKMIVALHQDPTRPLYNRALQGQYPPASTIKPFIGLIGLATHTITPETTIRDPGWYQLNGKGRRYRDWRKEGHGDTNLHKAISESCDTFYYRLANQMGIDLIAHHLAAFGFGKPTTIDIENENSGILPSSAWKSKVHQTPWYPGDTLSAGIGQGYFLTTPLQLAKAVSMIANRGVGYRPFLNPPDKPITPTHQINTASPEDWDEIIRGMEAVIAHPRGTAHRLLNKSKFRFAGKTGTAQVFSLKENESYQASRLEHHLKDHTLFIAFAPIEAPKIAVAVILENSPGSPEVAQAVMNAYLRSEQ